MSELFGEIVEWALAQGATQINKLPGCWEAVLDVDAKRRFRVAVNAHGHEVPTSKGEPVPPFHALVCDEVYMRIACLSPAGGATLGDHEFEAELIELFRASRLGLAGKLLPGVVLPDGTEVPF